MLPVALLLAAQSMIASPGTPAPAPCRPSQLRLSADGRGGDFGGMSHAGTELSIRNLGPDCTIPALPRIEWRDARGHALPAVRQAPIGMHPGPVMLPVRIGAGHRATIDLRWVSGPVYPVNHSVRAASVVVAIGTGLRSPLRAVLYGNAGKPVTFEQTPARAAEGMAAG